MNLSALSDPSLALELARQRALAAAAAPGSQAAIAAARVIHHLVREQLSRQPRYWRSPEDTATQCVLEDMARVAAQGEDP